MGRRVGDGRRLGARHSTGPPVTMIVPFPPGGVADTVARPVAEALHGVKQAVVIENKAARRRHRMAQVAKSKPDGYVVLLALSSLVVLPEADTCSAARPRSR